jgi:hypothetical protein
MLSITLSPSVILVDAGVGYCHASFLFHFFPFIRLSFTKLGDSILHYSWYEVYTVEVEDIFWRKTSLQIIYV